MLQSICLLRVGVTHVYGRWLPGRAGGAPAHGMAYYESEPSQQGASLGDALAAVLGRVLPQRRLLSPHVQVGLASPHFRSAIVAFAKLPKAAQDRQLVISQRFCREYRVDPASVSVLGSSLGAAKGGGESILCAAISKTLLAQINAALAAKKLHADLIAPDYMLSFADTDTRAFEAPGIALMQRSDGGTILVWNKEKAIVHVGAFASENDDEDGRRTASKIIRYAKIVGSAGRAIAVYADGRIPDALASAFPGQGLILVRWPAGQGVWGRLIGAAGI